MGDDVASCPALARRLGLPGVTGRHRHGSVESLGDLAVLGGDISHTGAYCAGWERLELGSRRGHPDPRREPASAAPLITWSLIAINVGVFLTEPSGVTHLGLHAARDGAAGLHAGGVLRPARRDPPRADSQPPARRASLRGRRPTPASAVPAITESRQATMAVGAGVDVPSRRLDPPARQHAVPADLRQQRRGPDGSAALPGFYLLCGYVAAYGFALGNASSTEALIGASGAIAGVLGAYLVVFPAARVTSLSRSCSSCRYGCRPGSCWAAGSCCNGHTPGRPGSASGAGVAYLAHLYGFVAGAVIALLLRRYLTTVRTIEPWHRVSHHGVIRPMSR